MYTMFKNKTIAKNTLMLNIIWKHMYTKRYLSTLYAFLNNGVIQLPKCMKDVKREKQITLFIVFL